jgi:hypothetical protein
MIITILAAMLSPAVVSGLAVALYAWFELSLRRFCGVVARTS